MRIKLTVDEREDKIDLFSEDDEKISLMQRFGADENGNMNWAIYTELVINYGDDMPTWIDNLREIIKAVEKHYGYPFDLIKLVKKGKLLTEDPDHGD